MVAIGLIDIPPEIQLQIAEFVETSQTLKALSVTCRSLCSIAQSLLFESLRIDLRKPLRGSIDDLLANPQICTAIRFLELRGRFRYGRNSNVPRGDNQILFLIEQLIPGMVGLKGVWVHQVNLTVAFMESFLEVAAKYPLKVKLGWNVYPFGTSSMANAPLRISHLHLGASIDNSSFDLYRAIFVASAATLTELNVRVDGDEFTQLADIDLPCLHHLILLIPTEYEPSRTSAATFITAQRAIRKLDLRGKVYPLPPLPPSALPNLRELNASTELVNQLVPGRPVEAIEVSTSQWVDQDWFGEEVARSTARVRKLRVHLNTPIRETRIVKQMVTILPSLESLWLPVSADTLLEVVEVLTSLKCLAHLRIGLYHRETWVNHDVGAIATQLRKANSCFSFIEVREIGVSGWKNTTSVWNEMFGAFHHMESVFEAFHASHLNQPSIDDSTSDLTTRIEHIDRLRFCF